MNLVSRLLHLPTLAVGLFSLVTLAADSWDDFRGPQGNGHASTETAVPLHWSGTENVRWKTAIPHLGHSSPVVRDGKVWLTTATEDGRAFYVYCLSSKTGEVLFQNKVFASENPESLGNGKGANTYATPSPVLEDGRAYVHYGSFGTACFDTRDFSLVWKRDDLRCRHYRGASSSPLLFRDLLILTFDGADLQYTIGLNKNTGETVWKTDRSVKWNDEHVEQKMVQEGDWRKAHSTPIIVEVDGKPQLFSVGAKAAYGYDPVNGRELWKVEFHNWSAAPRPVFHKNHFLFVTGFSRAELWSLRAGGEGDVTESHVEWKIKNPIPKYASPLVVDDLLYIAAEESFLSCLDPKTGEVVWTERVGGKFRSSPVYANGRIYFCNQSGETFVIKPGRTFELLAKNDLGLPDEPGRGRNHPPGITACPAVADGAFFLRTREAVYCIAED